MISGKFLTLDRVASLQRHAQDTIDGRQTLLLRPVNACELLDLCSAWLELETRVKCEEANRAYVERVKERARGDDDA